MFCGILWAISEELLMNLNRNTCSKIRLSKLLPNFSDPMPQVKLLHLKWVGCIDIIFFTTAMTWWYHIITMGMGLLPDMQNCSLRMPQECWERFPHHRLQMKPQVNDPSMHHGTCVNTCRDACRDRYPPVTWENIPCIPSACATHNFTYQVRGPWDRVTKATFITGGNT